MNTGEITVDVLATNSNTMTIEKNGMITTYESFYMNTGYAKLLTATDTAKDYLSTQNNNTHLDSFVTQSFNGTVDVEQAKKVTSSIATIADHINADKPDQIIIPIVSKTSTSLGLLGTQVMSGYDEQFYDSGPKKVFIIPPEPKIVGTIGGHIDPLKKGFINKSWPPKDTTIKFSERYCKRVGLPEGFSMETKTKNSTDSKDNPVTGNPDSGTLIASITIKYRFNGNSKEVTQTFPVNSSDTDTTGDTPPGDLVSKYILGNIKKNKKINASTTSAEDRFLLFLYKELGDFVQVLIYIIACQCNATEHDLASQASVAAIIKLLYILLTTDYIVYLRLRAFLQHVLYTGVRAGVKSGQAIYWHNCPELLSFSTIKQRLETYNKSLYYDILHHNIANLNYLCKIRFGLNKLKKFDKTIQKTIQEKKAHNKQAKRILQFFSLWVPNRMIRGKFTSKYKKIYLSRIASGCNYLTSDESNDTNNDEILDKIIGNINILINEIINMIIELIIYHKYYSELLEKCDIGRINLPCLAESVARTIKLRLDLIEELRNIFTDIEDIDSILFETLLDKINGTLVIVETIDDIYALASTESDASRASIPSADGQSIEAILINNCTGAPPDGSMDDGSMDDSASISLPPPPPPLPVAPAPAPDDIAMGYLGSSSASAGPSSSGPSSSGSSSSGLDTDLRMQIQGINNLINKIASLKEKYQSTTYFSIISTSQVIIINPKFLIIKYESEDEFEDESKDEFEDESKDESEDESKIIPYTIGARGNDIIDNELKSVYAMLELELVGEQKSPAKGGSGSQVTKKHLKINIQGKNNNRKNVTKKHRKMIKSRNKVMTGGAGEKRQGPNLVSELEQRPKDEVPDYIRTMSNEELAEDNDPSNYLTQALPNSATRMTLEHVETFNMSQEDFIWYVAEQIVSKFAPINNYTTQEMTTLVYDIIVNENITFQELLDTFSIPYDINYNTIINNAKIPVSENFVSICDRLPGEIPEPEPEAVMVDAEPLFNSPVPQPKKSESAVSVEFDGGYSGINKKKHKSRKNKKTRRNTRHKTRHKTRRKTKKIRTRKNKQVRRKH
jgi:hypothetical protein